MGMELLESASEEPPSILQPVVDIQETPRTPSKPQPMVKLLPCKPLPLPPQQASKLMLWVDGCLAPALPTPLFIDVSTAQALAASKKVSHDSGSSSSDDAARCMESAPAGAAAASSSAKCFAAVSPAAAAPVGGAADSAVEELSGERLDAHLNDAAMGTEEDLPTEGLELPTARTTHDDHHGSSSSGGSASVPLHPTNRAASVELSPPVSTSRVGGSGGKRTRPASAAAATYGGGGATSGGGLFGSDPIQHAQQQGGSFSCRHRSSLSSGLSSESVAEEPDESQFSHRPGSRGLSDVLGDLDSWQLESPSKRPAVSRNGLSPPALANLSVRSSVTSPMRLRTPSSLSLSRPLSAAGRPMAAPTRPPTACCSAAAADARCCVPEPSLATPKSAAAAAADVSAAAAARMGATPASAASARIGSIGGSIGSSIGGIGGGCVGAGSSSAPVAPTPLPAPPKRLQRGLMAAGQPAPIAEADEQGQAQRQGQEQGGQEGHKESTQQATDEPPAPPPSPIVGPRSVPSRDVPWGLAKRKQRSEDLELPSSLLHVESELDALRIEPRPSKLLRSAGR